MQERRARGEAEAANQAKDEFLAMLGHELRNPIGAITNAAHILERQGPGGEGDKLARRVIGRQTAILKRMIDDLLDMSRVLTGKISLERRPIDLALCVRNAVENLGAAGKTVDHVIEVRTEPVWVEGDPARIDQVLANLVINAVNHTPPGKHIRVELTRATARPVLARGGAPVIHPEGEALLCVSDEGVGIAPAALPRVFDLFFQEQQQPDRPKSGLGLGLTLVQRIAQLHGGGVTAESAGIGQGARFCMRIPAIVTPQAAAAAPTPAAPRPRRVMLIEDNDDARETLKTTLELDGHVVETAADGPTALDMLKRFIPDAVIVDIGLPVMDGHEVARAIRAAGVRNPEGGPAVLIALTGYGLPEDQRRARAAGFDAHLVKPADFTKLAALIAPGGVARGVG